MSDSGTQVIFRELFKQHGVVQIPMIQRDYAQGRVSENEVRDQFLTALYEKLILPVGSAELPLNLDFVYGNVEGEGDNAKFSPLDGQQRLTTLYLLHWYLAWKDGKWDEFDSFLLDADRNSRFAYRVRPSSNDFYDFLATFRPEVAPDSLENCLSGLIKDQPEYFRSWKLDPTIQATLVMLDAIHERFNGTSGLFERLVDKDNPSITFQLLDLDEFDLSDDLYIKMNARGMPLTPFETFKARYEQELEEQFDGETREIDGQSFDIAEFVSRRIDTQWYDLLWAQFAGRKDRAAASDEGLFNLFRAVALVTRRPTQPNCLGDLVRLNSHLPNFAEFHKRGWLDEYFTNALIPIIETWSKDNEFTSLLPSKVYFNDTKAFKTLVADSRGLGVPEVVMFMAYVLFVREHEGEIDPDAFQDWMRVIHNLEYNSNVDREDRLPGAYQAILALLPYSDSILEHLAELEVTDELSAFPKPQFQEESIKAVLVLSDEGWRPLIDKAERHGYFRGQIDFLLDFCGVVNELDESEAKNWTPEQHDSFQMSFAYYLSIAEQMFTPSGISKLDFKWQRALLAQGDYFFERTAYRRVMLIDNPSDAYSWKRLLRGYSLREAKGRSILQSLWDKLDSTKPMAVQLDEIIEKTTDLQAWRSALIESPTAMAYCPKMTIRKESNQKVYLLSGVQMNSTHAELFSYILFNDELKSTADAKAFLPLRLFPDYIYSAKSDVEPGFRFTWDFGGKQLRLELEYGDSGFQFYFYTEEVREIDGLHEKLEAAGFAKKWTTLLVRFATLDDFYEELAEIQAALIAIQEED